MATKKKNSIVAILVCSLALALSIPGYAFAATNQGQCGVCPRGIAQTSTLTCLNILERNAMKIYDQRINQGIGYVDADNDGICDNYIGGNQGVGFIDADNDGVCDNYTGNNQGAGFIDENNNGVCDNFETQQNTRYNSGKHHGAGKGYNRY